MEAEAKPVKRGRRRKMDRTPEEAHRRRGNREAARRHKATKAKELDDAQVESAYYKQENTRLRQELEWYRAQQQSPPQQSPQQSPPQQSPPQQSPPQQFPLLFEQQHPAAHHPALPNLAMTQESNSIHLSQILAFQPKEFVQQMEADNNPHGLPVTTKAMKKIPMASGARRRR